jgi:adhesin/invasin
LEAAHATAGTANFTASATAGAATGLTITSANPQSAVVGTAVGSPPQVLAHDQFNNPVQGVAVTYVVTAGGGTVVPTTAITTGANGLATATSWTLGPVAGANTLEARATGLTTVQFSATGLAGSAAKLAFVAAPSSTAQSGVAFAAQPVIQLQDAGGNPVAQVGVVISATIAAGTGGSLTNASATTNASGVATFTGLTLSGPAGGFTLSFGSGSLTAVTAGVTLSAGPAASITAASATSQQATVGTAVAAPPSVLVTDNGGNPVPGVAVTFAVTGGGGSVTGGNATTNASGIATVGSWTLGTTAGPNTLTATSGGLSGSPVTFTANGTTGAPTQISVSTGNNQSATVNTAVTVPPAVLVTDQFGNPVPGETVTFTVTSGGGSVTGGTAITDAAGIATVGSWTLGTTAGTDNNTLEAAHATAGNVNFTASAAAGPAAALAFTVQPSATLAGQVITPAIQVAVRDAFGNLVTTASNSITLSLSTDPNGGTNLSGTLTKAAVGGIATFDDLSLDLSGVGFELEASSGGLPPATSAPFDIN